MSLPIHVDAYAGYRVNGRNHSSWMRIYSKSRLLRTAGTIQGPSTSRFEPPAESDTSCLFAEGSALPGHSRLNIVLRYAHVQEAHQTEAMKKLEKINAAREIAEFEKKTEARPESVPTISPTHSENASNFQASETESKSRRIN